MKLCAAQLASLKGDLQGNLQRHLQVVRQAAALGAGLVVFPELSLSGYEPSLARGLAVDSTSSLLAPLQALSDALGIVISVGLPLLAAQGVQIGMPILRPGLPPLLYAKQRLHSDELRWFVAADEPVVFEAGEHHLAPAICYESMFLSHAEQAHALGADVYLVSVAKTAQGIEEGYAHYPETARRFDMPVIMANCVGPADTFVGAGQSAAWDRQGRLLGALSAGEEGLLMLDTRQHRATSFPLAG